MAAPLFFTALRRLMGRRVADPGGHVDFCTVDAASDSQMLPTSARTSLESWLRHYLERYYFKTEFAIETDYVGKVLI